MVNHVPIMPQLTGVLTISTTLLSRDTAGTRLEGSFMFRGDSEWDAEVLRVPVAGVYE